MYNHRQKKNGTMEPPKKRMFDKKQARDMKNKQGIQRN